MSKRITMVDVARQAGVSQATVSLVLNDVPNTRVSEATRQRVKQIAAEIGYALKSPSIRGGGTPVIGMLIDEVTTTPFAAPLIEGAREEAAAQGCLLALFCTKADAEAEAGALATLSAMGAIGVIYATLMTQTVAPPPALLDLPAVLLNCHDTARRIPAVLPGDIVGGQSATEALIRAGHRRIAHIAGEDWGESARDRALGYRRALASADIAFDPALLAGPAWTIASGREVTEALLDLPDPPTAFFCFNDRVAIGCYEALRHRGLRVPQDASVVGFDDEDMVANLLPPLSTMVLPHDEMARLAVGELLARGGRAGPVSHAPRIKTECSLIPRASVAGPPGRTGAGRITT